MGTNCGDHPPVDTTNECAVPVGVSTEINFFCTYAGPAGDGYRNEYCKARSNAGEWGNASESGGGCSYDDCHPYLDYGFGCCDGCCGIVGAGANCERLSFTGNPIICCFNDLLCNGNNPQDNPSFCYSDPQRQHACADGQNGQPNYRSLVSPDCQDILSQYCTGTLPTDDPDSTAWLSRWTFNGGGTGSCSYAVARNMFLAGGTGHCFEPPPPIQGICNISTLLPIDAEGYFWAQRLVSAAMVRYTEQGFQIGSLPGFPGYNPWQDFLYSTVCCPYPGVCQDGLDTVCATQTAQRISLNPSVAQWCGCHLPEGEYQTYSALYNIPPQCTPMCNRAGTLPIVGINADPVNCEQDICIIDGVTVNLVEAQIGGGIDFNQICANCSGAQCSCIVSNTTVDITNSTIGGNVIPISEGCGAFTCSQTNPGITGPAIINVLCGTGSFNPYEQYEAEVAAAQASAKKSSWLWTLLVISIALVLIFFIILFIHPNLYPSSEITIPIEKPYNPQFERTSEFSSIEGSKSEVDFARSGEYSSISGSSGEGNFARISEEFSSIET